MSLQVQSIPPIPDLTAKIARSLVLAGLKALLEHNIRLNRVGDRFPA